MKDLLPLALDIPVGVIKEGGLTLKVSARGGQTVLSFFNTKAGRGFEVGFSPKTVGLLNDLLVEAKRKVGGLQ